MARQDNLSSSRSRTTSSRRKTHFGRPTTGSLSGADAGQNSLFYDFPLELRHAGENLEQQAAGGVRLIGVQSLAGRDEPDAVAGERRQLLVQVQDGSSEAVEFRDQGAVEFGRGCTRGPSLFPLVVRHNHSRGLRRTAIRRIGALDANAIDSTCARTKPVGFQCQREIPSKGPGVIRVFVIRHGHNFAGYLAATAHSDGLDSDRNHLLVRRPEDSRIRHCSGNLLFRRAR
jgi:hypothetical protein